MNSKVEKNINIKEVFNLVSTIISWTIFVLLVICAILLAYYFVATKVYVAKGKGYEPKFSLYTIISPSMVPNINVYDVIVDVKVDKPEDIKINDVITFNSSIPGVAGGTVTHRVIAINKDTSGNYYFQTKGDNNLVEDGVNVEFSNIIGKVALRIPQLGKIQSFVASSMGWLVIILIPALYVIVKSILKIAKTPKANEKIQEPPKDKPNPTESPIVELKIPEVMKKATEVTSKDPEVKTQKVISEDSKATAKDFETTLKEVETPKSPEIVSINNFFDEDDDMDLPKLKE